MKNNINILIKAIYAGILIGIGGISFLAIPNKIVGSLVFSIGLLTICMYGLNLYTGKVGYILINKNITYVKDLILIIIGNFIGTFITGNIIRLTRYSEYIEKASTLVQVKLNDNIISIFILSLFCGILMYIAVNNFKQVKDVFGKYIPIFMCVVTFILCGFEHSVANMFYFSISSTWSFKVVLYILTMIFGNGVGAVLIAMYYNRFYKN